MRETESEWERENRGHGGEEEVINLHFNNENERYESTKQHLIY